MEPNKLYLRAKKGNKRARKRLLKNFPRTFNILLEEEKEDREKARIEEEKRKKEEARIEEEKRKKEEERMQKEKRVEEEKKKLRETKVKRIERLLSFDFEDGNRVGELFEWYTTSRDVPIYGPPKVGPSGWGLVTYNEIIGHTTEYNTTGRYKGTMTKREALIRAVIEGKELSDTEGELTFEENDKEVLQAQVDDTLNLPYKGDGVFVVTLDGIKYELICDKRILKTFSEKTIPNVEYKMRGKVQGKLSFKNIKQAIEQRKNKNKGER